MHHNDRSFAFLFVLLVFLLGGIVGYGLSIYKFELSGKVYDSCSTDCPNPDPTIEPNFTISTTCPPLNYSKMEKACSKTSMTQEINIPFNNIQAPHNDIDYQEYGNDLSIENVDLSTGNGYSMQPTMFTGNKGIMKEYNGQELKEGMIIRFKNQNGYIIHRIKGNYLDTQGYLVTIGDSKRYHDTPIYPENITDIVVGVLFTKK